MKKLNWWKRNMQKNCGKLDTSRFLKIMMSIFTVLIYSAVAVILVTASIYFIKDGNLRLSNTIIIALATLLGAIKGMIILDYRSARKQHHIENGGGK
jgi:hypothetical protein